MKLSNILLAIPVTKFTHLQTFQYEIMNDIHNKNECGVGPSIKKNEWKWNSLWEMKNYLSRFCWLFKICMWEKNEEGRWKKN